MHLCLHDTFYLHCQYMSELFAYQLGWMEGNVPLEYHFVPICNQNKQLTHTGKNQYQFAILKKIILVHLSVWCVVKASNKPPVSSHGQRILTAELHTSFGSANIPTMAASIASWFSKREAWAAIRTTLSASTRLSKTWGNNSREKVGTCLGITESIKVWKEKLAVTNLYQIFVNWKFIQR